jgi:hypothetical protein
VGFQIEFPSCFYRMVNIIRTSPKPDDDDDDGDGDDNIF